MELSPGCGFEGHAIPVCVRECVRIVSGSVAFVCAEGTHSIHHLGISRYIRHAHSMHHLEIDMSRYNRHASAAANWHTLDAWRWLSTPAKHHCCVELVSKREACV